MCKLVKTAEAEMTFALVCQHYKQELNQFNKLLKLKQ